MTFAEAVSRYGIDRPDTRFGLELHDLGEPWRAPSSRCSPTCSPSGGVVRGINAGPRELPRSDLEALTELAKQHGAKGLVWAFVQEEGGARRSPSSCPTAEIEAITRRLDGTPGDLLLVVADEVTTVGQALSALRMELARRFDLIPQGRHDILWVVEFPAFFWDAERERWDAAHHPFTAPTGDLDDPGHLSSRAYDLVLDGAEIGGGSIRINRLEVQQRVFELLGIGAEEAAGAVRIPARRAALRRTAARRDRDGHRPDRRRARRSRLDPRHDRLPKGRERRRSAHRRAGAGRSGAAARARAPARLTRVRASVLSKTRPHTQRRALGPAEHMA